MCAHGRVRGGCGCCARCADGRVRGVRGAVHRAATGATRWEACAGSCRSGDVGRNIVCQQHPLNNNPRKRERGDASTDGGGRPAHSAVSATRVCVAATHVRVSSTHVRVAAAARRSLLLPGEPARHAGRPEDAARIHHLRRRPHAPARASGAAANRHGQRRERGVTAGSAPRLVARVGGGSSATRAPPHTRLHRRRTVTCRDAARHNCRCWCWCWRRR